MTPLFSIDDVDASTVVVSDDLMLTTNRDGWLQLYVTDRGRPRPLGTFASASAAWSAVDAIDIASTEQGTLKRAA